MTKTIIIFNRRSLRGNVDRNEKSWIESYIIGVVPYVGTWIEMQLNGYTKKMLVGRSLRGNVDRNRSYCSIAVYPA